MLSRAVSTRFCEAVGSGKRSQEVADRTPKDQQCLCVIVCVSINVQKHKLYIPYTEPSFPFIASAPFLHGFLTSVIFDQ